MYMGITAAWKARYMHAVLRNLILKIETIEHRKKMAIVNTMKANMKGRNDGHKPRMLDVGEIVARTWGRCWNERLQVLEKSSKFSTSYT